MSAHIFNIFEGNSFFYKTFETEPMSETILQVDTDSLVGLYGPADKYLSQIKDFFPKLKIIVRGELIKLMGDSKEIKKFEKRFELLLVHY